MPSINSLIYVRNAISSGQSANSAYRAMRKAATDLTEQTGQHWTGVGRQTFLRTYSQVLASRNKVGAALDFDPDSYPDDSVISQHDSRYSEKYLTWLTVYVRAPGEIEPDTEYFAVHSTDLITPAEAFQRAAKGFNDAQTAKHGTYPGATLVGITYSGTWRMSPREQ